MYSNLSPGVTTNESSFQGSIEFNISKITNSATEPIPECQEDYAATVSLVATGWVFENVNNELHFQ